MPYLFDTITDVSKIAENNRLHDLNLSEEQLKEAEKLEIHASRFDDPGDDFNIYRFIRRDGTILTEVRKEGY